VHAAEGHAACRESVEPMHRDRTSPSHPTKEADMTKGHKSGRRELKPSLVGRKIPARRDDSDAPGAADSPQANAPAEVGRDVDCYLPDSEVVREPGRTEPGGARDRHVVQAPQTQTAQRPRPLRARGACRMCGGWLAAA
jgi:hypothetical protein